MMRVLLVDDEKELLELLSSELTKRGFSVVAENDAERALKRIKHESFDWLVTDGYMAGESGFDLAGQARLRNPKMRRVLISGVYEDGVVAHSLFHHVFRKPLDIPAMIDAMSVSV